jgi:hypothetical protein
VGTGDGAHDAGSEPVLIRIELGFRSEGDEDAEAIADRIRESTAMIVGRGAIEEFRLRVVPLTEPKPGPRPD